MARSDTRQFFAVGLNREMDLPPDELAVHVDVLLLDPRGYVPRVVLWDTNGLTASRAALYAAPAWAVLEAELGAGRVPEVEIWHLRSGSEEIVLAADAAHTQADVGTIVHRLSGAGP